MFLSCGYFLFVLVLIFILTYLLVLTTNNPIWAISKAFDFKEVKDGERDWIRVLDGQPNRNGINATDISSVKYHSDGRILNATMWFYSLNELNKAKYNIHTIVYGMLVDSDLDRSTGKNGIDYQVEVKWNNMTRTWTEEINEISANGYTNQLSSPISHNESYIKNGNVVKLSLNLSKISNPEKYRLFFYAYNSNKDKSAPWTLDIVRWVYVPPPEFRLVTDDTIINTTKHNKELLEIRVETNSGLEPKVRFEKLRHDKYLKTEYQTEVLNMTEDDRTELKINLDSPEIRKITLPIKANIVFPPEYLDSHSVIRDNQTTNSSRYTIISQSSTAEPLILRLNIVEDPPFWKPISVIWSDLGGFITFIVTPISSFLTWLFGIYVGKNPQKFQKLKPKRRQKNKNRKKTNVNESAGLS